jgi:hypothetical protein
MHGVEELFNKVVVNNHLHLSSVFHRSLGIGTKAEYKITWFDPKAPTMLHPDFKDPYVTRYCDPTMISKYTGDAEPTRQKLNGELENCVSFVFVPGFPAREKICMADDYCSKPMNFICELSKNLLITID